MLCCSQWAGFGVAMGNAEAEVVKEAANHVTASNEDDGVAIVLEQLIAQNCDVADFSIGSLATTTLV